MSTYSHIPSSFLWGASSSAHQTEGNNTNSNWWKFETAPDSPFRERSGAAVDSYNRYREDMTLLADAGLSAYRFSIEWARIQPSEDTFSEHEIEHYREMVETAIGLGLQPVVTLHHFTNPQWFHESGGWSNPRAVDLFGRYVERISTVVKDVPWICTINEPNMIALLSGRDLSSTQQDGDPQDQTDTRAISRMALPSPSDEIAVVLTAAHRRAVDVLRPLVNGRIGWTISNQAFEPTPGNEELFRALKWSWEDRFLEVSRSDDFCGVQAYTTRAIGPDGPLSASPDEPLTLTGWLNRPDALGIALRNSWEVTGGVPLLVTENGIATADDTERVTYIQKAMEEVDAAIADGIDVRGYLHWSALDNYEWGEWDATFGLIAVDRASFARTPRPSLRWLGNLALAHQARHQPSEGVSARV